MRKISDELWTKMVEDSKLPWSANQGMIQLMEDLMDVCSESQIDRRYVFCSLLGLLKPMAEEIGWNREKFLTEIGNYWDLVEKRLSQLDEKIQ